MRAARVAVQILPTTFRCRLPAASGAPANSQGYLWSDVLELYLVAQGTTIRAATRAGDLLPTLSEAEQEIERLRREVEHLRQQTKTE